MSRAMFSHIHTRTHTRMWKTIFNVCVVVDRVSGDIPFRPVMCLNVLLKGMSQQRESLTNRGSNLISAMNQMQDTKPATDDTALISNEPTATSMKPRTSKVILGIFTALSLSAVIALVVILVNRKSDSEPNLPELVSCSFFAEYKNWVNYGLNGTGVTCPTAGQPMECTYTAQCMTVNPLCVPGTPAALTCVEGTCRILATVMPDFYLAGGLCNRSSSLPNCALCTSGPCDGVALCVSHDDCASDSLSYSLECHGDGHDAS